MKIDSLHINYNSAPYDTSYAKSNCHYGNMKLIGGVTIELSLPDHAIRMILDIAADFAVDQLASASKVSANEIRKASTGLVLEHAPEEF